MAAAVFGIYTIVNPDEPLTAEKIFVSITLFGLIRVPLIMLPFAIIDMVKMIVSLRRIDQFLKASELDGESVQRQTVDPKNAVEVDEASFSRTSDKVMTIVDRYDSILLTLTTILSLTHSDEFV